MPDAKEMWEAIKSRFGGNDESKKMQNYFVGNKMHKAFPLPVTEFPLPEELLTAREDSFHYQKKREATARKITLLSMRITFKSHHSLLLQHEHYALWEVIEFGDSYEVPTSNTDTTTTDTTSGETGTKSRRTVTLTAEDMQKKKNDVKARTTLLLSLPNEHQLRFSKYKTARELCAAILKTFGGNEATKKTKKNLLKPQYGNFRAEGSKTLEQTFSRLQVIIGQLQFMDVEVKHDDLNQKFLTSLAPEWLMHTIVWRNRSDLDTMSLDDLYNHLKVYESEVQKKTGPNSKNMAFISSVKHSSRNEDGNTACVPTASTNVPTASASVATISQDTACAYITSQSSDGLGWDWSYMENVGEDHALVVDEEAPIEFALIANTSTESKTGLPKCKDDTVTDYSRLEPTVESSPDDDKKRNSSVSKTVASPIIPKPFVKFVKASDSQSKSKIDKTETPKKSPVKYAKQYKKTNKKPNVRGNQRNWNNLKSHQLGPDFVMKKKACFYFGDFKHLAYDCRKRVKRGTTRSQNNTSQIPTHRPVVHRLHEPPMRPMRSNMNAARPNRTSFNKPAHSYTNRPFQRKSPVRSQYRAPWVPTVNRNFPPVNRKFFTGSRNFPTANRKFPTASRKFPTGSMKFSTADMGMKGKVVKPSACWVWKPLHNLSNKGPNNNSGSSQNKIEDKGYWDSGCSRHMTSNISYLSDYEPFDGGYVSFGQGGCKSTRKGTIKTGNLEFKNMYFVKDLKYNLFSVSQICDNKNNVLFAASKCIVLGRDFKLLDDANVLLRTPRQHNMYSIDLNNIIPHKDLTCLVAKASADECMKWHRRLDNLGKFEAKGDEGYFIGGNINPTATSTIPPADQVETLTVESPIPTASSPVPTACFTDSQEPSSEKKLISKRVTNQEETPSLDNILTLTNRFEDILRVTTNSEESNGVEADVSNTETTITASPTPTLRIHRDHPKSQIIGPVDTLIQTNNKFKEISDALQDLSWVEAMQEELLQFKIQKVWTLVDCSKGEEGIDYDEVFSPVARIEAIRLFLAYASFMGFTVYQMDVKIAFLYGTIDEEVYSDVRSLNTPMDKENPWGKDDTGKDVDLHLYRSMIGSLMYLTASRPDIMFAVCAYARHQVTPKECHLHAVKMIFRYLKGHPKLGLWYPKDSPFDLVAYSDSDYGGAIQDHKSTTRGCQFLSRDSFHGNTRSRQLDCFEKKLINVDHIHTDENVADLLTKPFDAGRFQYLVGDGSGTPTAPHHTSSPEAQPSSHTYISSPTLPTVTTIPIVTLSETTPLSQGEACPTDSGSVADQDRANIAKTSTLPHESTSRVTSLAADEGTQALEITELKANVKFLEDRQGEGINLSGVDASIKGRRLDEEEVATERVSSDTEEIRLDKREVAAERVSDDTEEMATVLIIMDATSVLSSGGVQVVPTAAVVAPANVSISTGSGVVPTASITISTATLIFATATTVTPYTRRKGKENMMIEGLDRSNETIPKHLEEYEQVAAELTIGERIDLIFELVKYQDHHSKILQYQAHQRKTRTKKQKRDFYMAVIRNNLGWKVKDFKGMSLVEAKFKTVLEQIKCGVSKISEGEAAWLKRKGIRSEQESAKKQKTSKEVPEEVKSSDEVPEEKIKELIRLVPIEEIDREDLNQLWALVKETLSVRPATDEKEMELWLKLKRLYEPDVEDHLWTHTQHIMHAPIEWRLYDTYGVHHGRIVRNKMHKAFPLPVTEFLLPEELPTARENSCHCQKKREATARKIALLSMSRRNCQSKVAVTLKGLHKGYDRFQTLLSQLETHGAGVLHEDANQKFLRSLPSSWSQVALIMRTKPCTNDVSTAYSVSSLSVSKSQKEGSSLYTDEVIHSFFVNQSSAPQLDYDELEQINDDDMKEMDLKWQVAMISMRIKKFQKRTGRKLQFDTKDPVGIDKTKVECFNCHKMGHFARDCKAKGNQDNRRRDAGYNGNKARDNGRRPTYEDDSKALVTIDKEDIDWSGHVDEDAQNYAMMAYSSSNSGSDNEVKSYSKTCEESYARLNKLYDEQRDKLGDASVEITAYTLALKKVKARILCHQQNQIAMNKRLEALKEKEDLKTKFENWQNFSKNLSRLLNTQMSANDKFGLGYGDYRYSSILSYENEVLQSVFMNKSSDLEDTSINDRYADGMHAVPPPMTRNYMPSGPDVEIDYSKFTYGLKLTLVNELDSKSSEYVSYESDSSVETTTSMLKPEENAPKIICEPKVWTDAPIIEEYELDSDNDSVSNVQKDKEKPSFAFTDSVKHVKTYGENVKETGTPNHSPKIEKQDKNGHTKKGLSYAFTRKACFDDPHRALKDKGIVDSGCSRHMTGNKVHLADYQEFKGDSVAFGGSNGRITGKGKIKAGKLDFEDVYYVEELKHYNLFSVS
nr:ribonuclease H-like domain, reverse transcriptase, RNA-dependent DNA polymerase [Tanacetum cinerariifolium]